MRSHPVALALLAVIFSTSNMAVGQASEDLSPTSSQITQSITEGNLVQLKGNTRPEARASNDRGRVPDDMRLDHMMLLLQRTPAREQALKQFINQIHDPSSPLFHHWITADQLGQQYGVTPAEITEVTDWLQSQGFEVNVIYRNGILIDFSGNAGQIREAFHTEIHHLVVNGQPHIANVSDPQIPAALAAIVAGVVSLNDFKPHPMFKRRSTSARTLPMYSTSEGYYALVPADLAKIYNFNSAFNAGISGQGQTIVVVEDSDLYTTADWKTFRSTFGLASAYPSGSLTQTHPASTPTNNCTDPGTSSASGEETLDAEWSSAGAPNAAIEVASCSDTTTNFGGFIALQNILNASTAPPAVVSISYGEGEPLVGAAFNLYIKNLYMQAVTAGVSVFVSSGDDGASSDFHETYATYGISVNAYTSTPYNVSVGGTDFADSYENVNSTYWGATNSSTYGSALSYIPEIPWNDSCASVLIGDDVGLLPTYGSDGLCNNSNAIADGFLTTAGGSGGPSGCATGTPDTPYVVSGSCAGYAKPSWQAGFAGIQSDGVRDVPDVSLFAADGVWLHYYVFCFSDTSNGGDSCSGTPDTWSGAGGTSFASPIMAAIQALANQASGSRWGNPNPTYYALAANEYGAAGSTSCNSALGNKVGSACIFYDVTQIPLLYTDIGSSGGDNDVPCTGSNCYLPSGTYGVLSKAPQKLSSATVTNLGSGYTSAPSCTMSGGGGTGATCSAKLTGVVSSFTLTNGGTGYNEFPFPICTLTGGGGTGATCETIEAFNGVLSGVFATNFGSGYTSAPTCTITEGDGTGATCTATEEKGIAVTLTATGSGYTTPPSCVLTGGGGTGGKCATVAALNSANADQPAFGSTKGWDFTSGIGTVNAWNLVSAFKTRPAISVTPTSLAFGTETVDVKTAVKTVTVKNTGNVAVLISANGISISGTNSSSFTSSTTCPVSSSSTSTLAAGASCIISVTLDPQTTGALTATLAVADNVISSPQKVTLTGTGTDVSLSPAALAFGTVTTNKTLSVTVKNIGATTLVFSKAPTITGTGAAKFAVLAYSATGPLSTCLNGTVTLAQNATCTYSVKFTNAVDITAFTAALNIFDNAAGSPQLVPLTGNGTEVTLSPATLAFGTVTTNKTLSVTVKNVGTTTLDFSKAPTLTGTGAAKFAVLAYSATGPLSTCLNGTVTLAQNATCTYSVKFTNAVDTTAFTADLNIFDNGGGSPQLVPLTGNGTEVTVTPATLAFGTVTTNKTLSVTVKNVGTTTLDFSKAPTVTGTGAANFVVQPYSATGPVSTCLNGTVTLAQNATCTYTVKFTNAGGTTSFTTDLNIFDNGGGSPQLVPMTATD
jgi:hypothetical protein